MIVTAVVAVVGVATAVSPTASGATLDCTTYAQAFQTDVSGNGWYGQEVQSRVPGKTIHLGYVSGLPNPIGYIAHTGVVAPGSRITFDYYRTADGLHVTSHTTQPANSGGVVRQQSEVRNFDGFFFAFTVYATFTQKCGGSTRAFLGYVDSF